MGQMEVAKSREDNARSGREVGVAELRDLLHQEQTMRVGKKAKVRKKGTKVRGMAYRYKEE